jgi:hypothetical protein
MGIDVDDGEIGNRGFERGRGGHVFSSRRLESAA